ncbi:L-type lectin-domain containing receptor kinase IV.1-like [Iris pallida]|uniref:L-type lectin-domain containing receptor kinase IV.1-like n=1 Tax=Iris pallida TaxID=29817 RepID=A0AAX6GDI2_IRIPA|nr:L-type lectin-domain containing receptor kinase IV.1-like [Iris pallida]KAJ6853045.1 L-type lectin-domain containing receptor kinase IV.1-like [Iris pallida]
MANTNIVEKDRGEPVDELTKSKGAGKKAWPIASFVSLVSRSRPPGSIDETPSTLRSAPRNPLNTKDPLVEATAK